MKHLMFCVTNVMTQNTSAASTVPMPHDDVTTEPPAIYQQIDEAFEGRYVAPCTVVKRLEVDDDVLSEQPLVYTGVERLMVSLGAAVSIRRSNIVLEE